MPTDLLESSSWSHYVPGNAGVNGLRTVAAFVSGCLKNGVFDLIKSDFEGDDLTPLEEAFENIAGKPWFDPGARDQFSRSLIEKFPGGTFNAKRDREAAENIARLLHATT